MTATLTFDKVKVVRPLPPGFSGGFVGMGTGGFYRAQFDDFEISYGTFV